MHSRRSIIAAVACLHLLDVPLSYAWSCNLTMIGSRVQPQNLSAAQTSLDCDPGADEIGTTITVGVSQELWSETFPGACPQLLPCDISQASPIPTQLYDTSLACHAGHQDLCPCAGVCFSQL